MPQAPAVVERRGMFSTEQIVNWLHDNGPVVSTTGHAVKRIADALGLLQNTASSAIRRLEDRGLVWAVRDPRCMGVYGVGLPTQPQPELPFMPTGYRVPRRRRAAGTTAERILELLRTEGDLTSPSGAMTGALAERLGVSHGAVHAAVKQLDRRRLIQWERHKGKTYAIRSCDLSSKGAEEIKAAVIVGLYRAGFLRNADAGDVCKAIGLDVGVLRSRVRAASSADTAARR